jgi:hypothetical protein
MKWEYETIMLNGIDCVEIVRNICIKLNYAEWNWLCGNNNKHLYKIKCIQEWKESLMKKILILNGLWLYDGNQRKHF